MHFQPTSLGRDYFNDLLAEIQLPESVYDRATGHYEAVGKWLDADGSSIASYKPKVYPQGSIALGTAIQPVAGDEHDVDAVCLLAKPPPSITQEALKKMVGDRLKENERYRDMLDPPEGNRRCWTLKYRERPAFHLDVLPAVPDDYSRLTARGVRYDWAKTAIRITDKTTWPTRPSVDQWQRSNPKGFRAWFEWQMQQRLEEARRALDRGRPIFVPTVHAEAEPPPAHRTPTPLQGAVQILKFHRDVYFKDRNDDQEDKPISIIITTLAATAYENEASLAEAVLAIVPKMQEMDYQGDDGTYRIENPVDPRENFADKWAEEPRKPVLFFEWLAAVEGLVERVAGASSIAELRSAVKDGLDHGRAQTALNKTIDTHSATGSPLVPPRTTRAARPTASYPSTPPWNAC